MAIHFDLVDLRLFVYIAEELNLTRGAARAHMSVPAASMRLKGLEDTFGARLFNRETQGLSLRPPGQALLRHAHQMLQQLERLNGDMQEYARGVKGDVRLSATTAVINEFLPGVLAAYLNEHTDINVELRERQSDDIVRGIIDGTIDIGIVAASVATGAVETVPYRKERLVLVAGRRHPLARTPSTRFSDVLEHDFVGLHEASALPAFLKRMANDLRMPLKIRVQVNSFDAVCRMVEANVGIGVLPESAAARIARTMDIHLIQLDEPWALRDLVICVRSMSSLPGFARDLIELLAAESKAYAAQRSEGALEEKSLAASLAPGICLPGPV
jgi:DNA-binding transcriptional LysR family regulator